jgi:hypothetical protein
MVFWCEIPKGNTPLRKKSKRAKEPTKLTGYFKQQKNHKVPKKIEKNKK